MLACFQGALENLENWPLFIAKEDFTEKTSGIWGSQKQTAKNLLKKNLFQEM